MQARTSVTSRKPVLPSAALFVLQLSKETREEEGHSPSLHQEKSLFRQVFLRGGRFKFFKVLLLSFHFLFFSSFSPSSSFRRAISKRASNATFSPSLAAFFCAAAAAAAAYVYRVAKNVLLKIKIHYLLHAT